MTVTFPGRIAVVNRGEAAVRLIRAVRELNAEYDCDIKTIALHTDAERRAMFVRQADEAVTLRRTSAGIAYLDHAELERAAAGIQRRRGVGRLGFRRRGHRLRRAVRAPEAHVHRAAAGGDAHPGRQGRSQIAGRKGGRSARTVERWPRRDPRGRPPPRRGHRLPVDHQGPQWRWRPRYPQGVRPRRTRRRTGAHAGRGRAFVRGSGGVPRTPCHRCPPCRGSGHRRQLRQCLGAGSARLLHPTPKPEGDRRVQLPAY